MFRWILPVTIGVAAVGIMIFGFFHLKKNITAGADPLTYISRDAVIIIRAKTITGFFAAVNRGTGFWPDLTRILKSEFLNTQAGFLDSLISGNPSFSKLAAEKGLYLSIHASGKDNFDAVFYVDMSRPGEAGVPGGLIREILPGNASVTERSFERARIYETVVRMDGRNRDLSWTINNGILILSFSPFLLENAVKQSGSQASVTDDPSFRKVEVTSGNDADANVFINLKLLPGYLSAYARGDTKSYLAGITDLANWAELDLHLRNDILMLNGFSYSHTDENNYLNIFRGQSTVPITMESVIPAYSSAFLVLGLSDRELFHERYLEWLLQAGRLSGYDQMCASFVRLTGADPVKTFHSFMDHEVAMVLTGWDEPEEKGESFLVIKTRSQSMALQAMLELLKHHADNAGNSPDSYRHVYRADSEASFDIYSFPFDRTGELLFGSLFGPVNTSWFSFVGNYLVFGESAGSVSEFIQANVLNRTLTFNSRFREFSEYLVTSSNLYFYSNVPRSAGMISSLFRDDIAASMTGNLGSLRKFQAMALQFNGGRELVYNNIFLKYSPEVIEEPRTEWQTLLDTLSDFKPLLLVNHNTGENEIFVQDVNNTIYLINNAGRILWKKPLPGRIMGNVHQVDVFRNNRLQMLFNTREQIFLVDRNGNDVGRYPVRLPSPATGGISVFDYDNDKNYRIFTAHEDKSVTVRSREGNILSGWEFPGTEHNVYKEIRFFRIGGRDYIVFADRHRVYITDRRGRIRVKPAVAFPVSSRNSIGYEGRTPTTDPRLALTDTTGRVWHIYFDGKTEPVNNSTYSPDHFFEFHDVSGDGYKDHIFLDNNRLDVYKRDGSLIFSREFAVSVDHAPAYYHFSQNDRKLGVISRDQGQIYLIGSNGEIYSGFPLAGRSEFTIGLLHPGRGNYHLIVGSDNNFLYNYIVR
jgi:WD40 repeat protein